MEVCENEWRVGGMSGECGRNEWRVGEMNGEWEK